MDSGIPGPATRAAPQLPAARAYRLGEHTEPWRVTADFLGVALVALIVVMYAMRKVLGQGDLRAYLAAAEAALSGIDPYLHENLTALARRPMQPFIYPPIALLPFFPLTAIPIQQAITMWMAANVVLLAGLVAWWWRSLGRSVGLLPVALIAVFGWNSSALSALRAGNIALVEAALLWAAIVCFARDRRGLFATLVVAAACFKLKPAVFLLLLLVPTERSAPSPRLLLASLVVLATLVLVPIAVGPASHWTFFLRNVPQAEMMGFSNPGGLSLATVLVQILGVPHASVKLAGQAAWALVGVALCAAGLPFFRAVLRARDPRLVAMAALFLYLLLDPRPMAHGFVLLTPAVLFFAPRPFEGATGRLMLSLVLAAQGLGAFFHASADSVVFVFAPFLLTACVWLLVVSSEGRRIATPDAA